MDDTIPRVTDDELVSKTVDEIPVSSPVPSDVREKVSVERVPGGPPVILRHAERTSQGNVGSSPVSRVERNGPRGNISGKPVVSGDPISKEHGGWSVFQFPEPVPGDRRGTSLEETRGEGLVRVRWDGSGPCMSWSVISSPTGTLTTLRGRGSGSWSPLFPWYLTSVCRPSRPSVRYSSYGRQSDPGTTVDWTGPDYTGPVTIRYPLPGNSTDPLVLFPTSRGTQNLTLY